MSDSNERHNTIREALKKAQLSIRCSIISAENYVAKVYRGEADRPPESLYLVNNKPIETTGTSAAQAVTACEDAVMAHLGVAMVKLTSEEETLAEVELLRKRVADLEAASRPAEPRPARPKAPATAAT